MAGLSFFDRMKSAVSGAASGWKFSGRGGQYGLWPSLTPSSNFDYQTQAGDPTQNAIVMATLLWIMRAFPEAPIRIMKRTPGGDAEVINHSVTRLISQPNPFYSGLLLWQATVVSLNLSGNGYWYKMRNRMGVPVQLFYIPHFQVYPRWDASGSKFISYYEYRIENERIALPVEDVVHFRNGLDPNNTRSGLSPLAGAFREIFTDNEAANYTATLLRNMGIPGLIISPSGPDAVMDDPENVKALVKAKISGDKRGDPLVLDGGVKVDMISLSPADMNIRELRRIPEERISALLGVPAMVAGLGAGLERSTFTNMTEARSMAYESNIVPTYRLLANELDRTLVAEMGDVESEHANFDISKVRVLQDDQTMLFQRYSLGYQAGWVKRSEPRLQAGLPVDDGDNVYITDVVPATAQLQADTTAKTAQITAESMAASRPVGGDRPSNNDGTPQPGQKPVPQH